MRTRKRPRSSPARVTAVLLAALAACDERHEVRRKATCEAGAATEAAPVLEGAFEITRLPLSQLPGPLALGDCDGDGRPELLVALTSTFYRITEGGALVPLPSQPVWGALGGQGATLVDLDGDGRVDLLSAGPNVELRRGRGDCTFEPPVTIGGVADLARQVLPADVDQDGLPDVVVGLLESPRAPFVVFRARGDGTFEPVPYRARPSERRGGYVSFGAVFDDVDGDGAPDFFGLLDGGDSWFAWGRPGEEPGAPAWLHRDAPLSEAIRYQNPMALSALDFDRDGRVDYFMAGSGDQNLLLGNRGPRDLPDVACPAGLVGPTAEPIVYWSSLAVDFDRDGWTDLFTLRHGDEAVRPDHRRTSLPPGLFLNRGGVFTDVGPAVLPVALAAEIAVCADLDGEGRPSCIAADADGLVLLRNRLRPVARWAGLRLRATLSPPHGAGARVSLDGASPPLLVVAGPQSPTQALHTLDVVLPASADTIAATIQWPSGITQRIPALPADRYTEITEPAAVRLSARVLPADGQSTLEITLDPQSMGAKDAKVLLEGDGTWLGPEEPAKDGTIHRTLRAPNSPGSARLRCLFDGTPLVIAPRVRFE